VWAGLITAQSLLIESEEIGEGWIRLPIGDPRVEADFQLATSRALFLWDDASPEPDNSHRRAVTQSAALPLGILSGVLNLEMSTAGA
jgi:hypothetical protein